MIKELTMNEFYHFVRQFWNLVWKSQWFLWWKMEHYSVKYGTDQGVKNLLNVLSKILEGCILWNLKLAVIIVQKYIFWQ